MYLKSYRFFFFYEQNQRYRVFFCVFFHLVTTCIQGSVVSIVKSNATLTSCEFDENTADVRYSKECGCDTEDVKRDLTVLCFSFFLFSFQCIFSLSLYICQLLFEQTDECIVCSHVQSDIK